MGFFLWIMGFSCQKYIPGCIHLCNRDFFCPCLQKEASASYFVKEVNPVLTFEFTGVEGRMTGSEILTSGMVGKTVQILFDDSWANLTKTLVFRAGHIQTTVQYSTSPVVIPAAVLAHPFQKLFVGAYGIDQYGNLAIPTLMAEGPMIRYGTTPEELPADSKLICRKLQEQIGNLNHLQTNTKTSLVAAINELTSSQGSGMSKAAITLLITILRHALYESDQSDAIDALETALNAGATDPEVPEVTMTHITAVYTGDSVPVGTDIYSLQGLTVTAYYSDGTTAIITGYNLGGKISKAGNNTLSVVYNGQSTTVSIPGYETDKTLTGITAHYTGGSVPVGTALTALYPNLTVMAQYSDGSTEAVVGYGLSGAIANGGENEITVMFGGFTTTFTVTGEATLSGDTDIIAHWDFTSGSWIDTVSGIEAVHSDDVTIDGTGATLTSTASYVQIPVTLEGYDRDETIVEIKFGQMSLNYVGTALRLIMVGKGTQPHTVGMFYKNSWTNQSANQTGFTDVNAFSGQTVTLKIDGSNAPFYLGDQYICTGTPGHTYGYMSIGSSGSSTPGALVESITIRKEV